MKDCCSCCGVLILLPIVLLVLWVCPWIIVVAGMIGLVAWFFKLIIG